MQITTEMKRSFRTAFEALEKTEIPERNDIAGLMEIMTRFNDTCNAHKEDVLLKNLLVGIYGYVEEMSKK